MAARRITAGKFDELARRELLRRIENDVPYTINEVTLHVARGQRRLMKVLNQEAGMAALHEIVRQEHWLLNREACSYESWSVRR